MRTEGINFSFTISVFTVLVLVAFLLVTGCKDLLEQESSLSPSVEASKGILTPQEDPYGQLFDARSLGKFRVFYDPANEYGLVLYWMPRLEKLGTKGLRENYCPTDDGFQFDASSNVPLQVSLYDATHDWTDPVAEFYPESEHTGNFEDDLFLNICSRPILDNPQPCSGFLLYDETFENRKNFKYHSIQPGSKLVVFVSQPTLRARQIDGRLGLQMFEQTSLYGLVPMCLLNRPLDPTDPKYAAGDPEAGIKKSLMTDEYLFPSDSDGSSPQYRFTLNMYNQIEDCQNWYAQVGWVPVEIPLNQALIKPLPDDLRALSYHPQVSGAVCDAMRD
jgi:hypothetical protein